VDRLDVGEIANTVLIDPRKEVAHGPVIGQRVFLLRMLAAKYSRNRRAACSPVSAITVGMASELRIAGARIGDATSTTAGTAPALAAHAATRYVNSNSCIGSFPGSASTGLHPYFNGSLQLELVGADALIRWAFSPRSENLTQRFCGSHDSGRSSWTPSWTDFRDRVRQIRQPELASTWAFAEASSRRNFLLTHKITAKPVEERSD
jgi:hypothetical protein